MAIVVGFDVSPLLQGRTGTARYLTELGSALARHHADEVILRRFAIGRASLPPPPDTRWFRLPLRIVHRLWAVTGRPRAERLTGPVDVVHAGAPLPPPTRHPLVVTVHDLVALEHPDLHPTWSVSHQTRLLEAVRGRDVVVCASSQATADVLADRGVEPGRIVVARAGWTAMPPATASGFRPGSFVLAVGETSTRKDWATLLEAFALSADRGRLDGVTLVHAGPDAGGHDRLRRLASELRISDRVTFLGAVPDARLAGLYADAAALCLPSIAEGFGLPIVEALAAGCPVVASDIPVFREVSGGHARFVTVGDPEGFAEALEAVVWESPGRAERLAASSSWIDSLTFEATAAAVVRAYRLALER